MAITHEQTYYSQPFHSLTVIIHVLVFDGFDELDAIAPFEVFQTAARVGADCSVSIITHDQQDTVTAANGLQLVPDSVLPAPDGDDTPDLLVVPGGGWASENQGVRREIESGELPEAIGAHLTAGAQLASVCTGAMLLERAGVLNDRPAVTHHRALGDLRDANVEVLENRVVDTGEVVTTGGVTSGIDLALYLVSREFGDDVAEEVADILEYDREADVATVH